MVGITATGGDLVDVHVDRRCHQTQVVEPGLLPGLAPGNVAQVAVTVGMAAGLEPPFELGMVDQ